MSTYYAGLLADIGILTLGALSVYVILATNQLSLGNAGFMAIGSYLSSYLTVELRWPLTRRGGRRRRCQRASSASSSASRPCG